MPATDASEARALEPVPELVPPPGEPPTGSPVPPGDPSASPLSPPDWPERLSTTARHAVHWMARPRVRLSLVGVLLLLLGGVVVTNSVWTLPVVVVGALMVVVAWIGHRLEGRFAVEWGETGTELAFRATIKAAAVPDTARRATASGEIAAPPPAQAGDGTIIEGEAHTVEIDVGELKALIAAAEGAAPSPPADDIRIRRAADA